MPSYLVDPKISQRKFEQEIKNLLIVSSDMRKKGWIIEKMEFPIVRVTFLVTTLQPPVAILTAELNFFNYNLLPPSVKFLNPISLEPNIIVHGLQFTEHGLKNIVINSHPHTQLPFLCLPGVQEYHSHPQHNGDSWDIHRYTSEGTLYFLIYHIWLYCVSYIKTFIVNLPPLAIQNVQVGQIQMPEGQNNDKRIQ